jgi:Trypsin
MKKTTFLLLQALVLVFIACNREGIENGKSTFGIRHDKSLSEYEGLVLGNDPELPDFSPVVFFEYTINGKDFVASGVLVSPNWILTAGLNFYDRSEQSSPAPASDIKVKVGNDPNNPIATLSVSQLVFHPTWIASGQDYMDANDLCLVKLTSPYNAVIVNAKWL